MSFSSCLKRDHIGSASQSLLQRLTDLFWTGPDSKYIRVCGPGGLCPKCSMLAL